MVFVDIVGFTRIAEQLHPEVLVTELNDLFSAFDRIMDRYGMEKLKTIGDAYMFVGGVPQPERGHPVQAVLATMDIIDIVRLRNESCSLRAPAQKSGTSELFYPQWDIRVGMNTGNLMAGVVGEKKFTYDIWGDTVNLASRVESAGMPSRINLSQTTAERVGGFFDLEGRGKIDIKNKSPVEMFFVKGIKKDLSVSELGRHPDQRFWREFESQTGTCRDPDLV